MKRTLNALRAIWPPLLLAGTAWGLTLTSDALDLGAAVTGPLYVAGCIMSFDVGGRFSDYRQSRDRINTAVRASAQTGNSAHLSRCLYLLASMHKGSWCNRTALKGAAGAAMGPGGRQIIDEYFHMLGYRWWHLTPDGAFTKRSPFLRLTWWRGLVGVGRKVPA